MENLKDAVLNEIKSNIEGMNKQEAAHWVANEAYCASGSVSGLIYYHDTSTFFDKHEDAILDLAVEYEFEASPIKLGMRGFKNLLAWVAFEALKDRVFEENIDDLYPDSEG